MKADSFWINISHEEQVFFLDEGSDHVKWSVPPFDHMEVEPNGITRPLPDSMTLAGPALVSLFMVGWPTKDLDDHETLIYSFTEAGLLQIGSVYGNLILTQDGAALLQSVGLM